MNAQQKYSLETKPACVLASGPEESDGDGGYEYCVMFGDDDGEPIDENRECIWIIWEHEEVLRFGQHLADKYHLEFVMEAMPA